MILTTISGIQLFLNGPIIPSVLALGGAAYFGVTYYKTNKAVNKNRAAMQQQIINQDVRRFSKRKYYAASAGDGDECPFELESVDIEKCDFRGKDGKLLDKELYSYYVVHGDSMQYAGINNGDLIFVPKNFTLGDLREFPIILLIRYKEKKENKPWYKVRRTWYKGRITDDLAAEAVGIMSSPTFAKLTNQKGYKTDKWMLKDLEDRIKKYKETYVAYPEEYKEIVLSTTYNTKDNEIHFSIHPVPAIVGIVKESYTINE